MAFRLAGSIEDERPEWEALWERGCVGLAEAPTGGEGGTGASVLAYFEGRVELPLEGRWEEVDDVDYVAAYLAGLAPVRAGRLVVAPTHTRPALDAGEQVLWLDPGTAFGTGHHETTRMALEALDGLDLVGRNVLDLGSGSGILAIAADRLGAASAIGVDTDVATLAVARHNAALNRSRARFVLGSLGAAGLPRRFDVIVANLYAEIHAELLPAYASRLVDGGWALLTGILVRRLGLLQRSMPDRLEPVVERRDGPWALVALRARAGEPPP